MRSPRNLVLIGVFCCVYFVVMFSGGMLGIFSPIMIMVGGIISTLINGIVVMLYLAKVPQFGSLTILGLITGLGMMFTGHVWYVVPTAIITGLIGDTIARSGNYQGKLTNPLAYAVFQLWSMALVAPIFINSDDYFADIEAQMKSAEYADTMRHVFTPTMILIWGVATFIVCLIAGFIGMRTLKKHFTRAGIV